MRTYNHPVVPGSQAHLVKKEEDLMLKELALLQTFGRRGLTPEKSQLQLMFSFSDLHYEYKVCQRVLMKEKEAT